MRVLEEDLHARQIGLRARATSAGHGFVGFELGHVRLALQERGLGRFHLRVGLAARRFRRLERVARFLFKFAIQGAARHQLTDPCILRLPTRNIGVGADVSRLGRADIGLGGRHGSLRSTDRRCGQLDFGIGLDQPRLLLMEFIFQLWEEQVREKLPCLHPVADVHMELLDVGGQLGEQRRSLEGLDLTWLHALQAERFSQGPDGGDADRGRQRLLRVGRRRRMTATEQSQKSRNQQGSAYVSHSLLRPISSDRKVCSRRSRGRPDRATPTRSSRATALGQTPQEAPAGWPPWRPPDRR